jgi:molybdopterin-biosynthesis enzyme MoeA-like protein
MIEWVLDNHYQHLFLESAWIEKSVIIYGSMEAMLTPLMEQIEKDFEGIKVFSLPSVDHPEHGRHIELGVKGEPALVDRAYPELLNGLRSFELKFGPELVRP